MLDVGRLRLLLAISEHGGPSGAARALGRPAEEVASQISDWERELGMPLLDGERPTPAGRRLAEHAARLISHLEAAESDAAAVAGRIAGTLRLGIGAAAGRALLPDALASLRSAVPGLDVHVHQLADEQLGALGTAYDVVVAGEFAAAVPRRPDAAVERRELLTEPLLLAVPTRHRATGVSVRLAELSGEPWIGGSGDALVALERSAASAGFTPRLVARVTEDALALTLVSAGLGVALVPASAAPQPVEGVRFLSVLDGGLRRTVTAAVRRSAAADPAVRRLLDALASAARRVAAAVPGVAAPPPPAGAPASPLSGGSPVPPASPLPAAPPGPPVRRPDPLFDPLPPAVEPPRNGTGRATDLPGRRSEPWADRLPPVELPGSRSENANGSELPGRNGAPAYGGDLPGRNGMPTYGTELPGRNGTPTGTDMPGLPPPGADLGRPGRPARTGMPATPDLPAPGLPAPGTGELRPPSGTDLPRAGYGTAPAADLPASNGIADGAGHRARREAAGPNPYRPDTSGHVQPDPFRAGGAETGPNPYRSGQPGAARPEPFGAAELFGAGDRPASRPGALPPPAAPPGRPSLPGPRGDGGAFPAAGTDLGGRALGRRADEPRRSRAASRGGDGADGTLPPAPAGTEDVRLSIFEDLQSEWFIQRDESTPDRPWQMAADDGWRAAARLAEPTTAGTTTAGLPRRRPQAMVVPGAVGAPMTPGGEERRTYGVPHRSPQEVRGRLSSYRDGVRRGRHAERIEGDD